MSKKSLGSLEIFLVVIMIIIAGALVYSSLNAMGYPYHQSQVYKEYDSLFVKSSRSILYELESIKASNDRDSILSIIAANQLVIQKRQDDLINDLRQETNNNIEKTNSILSFWVGIMALLGVFVPIILQFKLRHFEQSEYRKLSNDVLEQRKKQREEFDNWLNDTKEKVNILNYTNELTAIFLGTQYRIIVEMNNNHDIYDSIWNNSIDNLEKIVTHTFKGIDTIENRIQLIKCLVYVSATLKLISSSTSRHRHRSVVSANNMVLDTITVLNTRNYINWQALHEKFKDLVLILRLVNFEL